MAKEYSTAKRAVIAQFFKDNYDKAVSVHDIMEYLKEQSISINKSSIYRYLDKLVEKNQILKFVADKGNMTLYQYTGEKSECSEHLHIQCVKCGKVSHLDCEFMNEFNLHLKNEHGHNLLCEKSILYGNCNSCN